MRFKAAVATNTHRMAVNWLRASVARKVLYLGGIGCWVGKAFMERDRWADPDYAYYVAVQVIFLVAWILWGLSSHTPDRRIICLGLHGLPDLAEASDSR